MVAGIATVAAGATAGAGGGSRLAVLGDSAGTPADTASGVGEAELLVLGSSTPQPMPIKAKSRTGGSGMRERKALCFDFIE